MSALAQNPILSAGERYRTFLPSLEERKGLLLSHLLGFCLFSEFALNFFKYDIPFTPSNSIPIRLVAIWLLVDRTYRVGRLRMGFWDYLMLGFFIITGIGMIFTATMSPQIQVSFDDYRRFLGMMLNPYLYYLVTKEAINRRGFRPDISVNWLIAGFTWSALVAFMQALDLFHARSWSQVYAGANLGFLRDVQDTSYASGTAAWWNSMALEMLVAFALVFGPTFRRQPRWYEWVLGVVFMSAFIATQSRGGLVAFAACCVGAFFWYVYHRKYAIAMTIAVIVGIGVAVWLFAVFALKIERFTRTLEGEKVKGSVYAQSIDSRVQQQRALFDIGAKVPLFGTGPSNYLFPGPRAKFVYLSSYSLMGDIDGQYGVVFAQFGLVGLLFLALMQGYMIAFIRRKTAYRPYAFAAYFVGIAFSIHGIVEFFLYGRVMIVLSLLAALAGSSFLASEEGRARFQRVVKLPIRPSTTGPSPVEP